MNLINAREAGAIKYYSDGYKARSVFTLANDVKPKQFAGVCFGVNPQQNGAMCHTIETSLTKGNAAPGGHRVTWHKDFNGATFPGKKINDL